MDKMRLLFIMLILCMSTWGQNSLNGVEVGTLYLYEVELTRIGETCDASNFTCEVYINNEYLKQWSFATDYESYKMQTPEGAIYQAVIRHNPNQPQEIMIRQGVDNTPVIMLKDISQEFNINFIIREVACHNSNHTLLNPQPARVIWHTINLKNMKAGEERPKHPATLDNLQENVWKTPCTTMSDNLEYYDETYKHFRNNFPRYAVQHLTVQVRWFLKKTDRVSQPPVLTLEQNLREQIQFFQGLKDNRIDAKTLLSPILQTAQIQSDLYDQAIADLAQGHGIYLSQSAFLQEGTYNFFTLHKAENFDVYKNNQWIISAPQIKLSDNFSTQDKWELRDNTYNSNTLYTPQYIAYPFLQSLATRNVWLVKYKEKEVPEKEKKEPEKEKILLACYDIQNLNTQAQSCFDAQAQNYSQVQNSLNNEISLSALYPKTLPSPSLKINFLALKLKPDDLKKLVQNDIAYYLYIPKSFYYKIEPNIAISLNKPLELPIPPGDTASLIQSGKLQWYIPVNRESPIAPLIYTQQAQPNTSNYGYLTLRPKEEIQLVVETRDKIKHNVTLDTLFQKIKSPDDFEFSNDPAQTLWMITWPTDPLPDGATENDYYNRLLQSVFYKEKTTVQYGFATPFDEIPKLEGKYDANTAAYSDITLILFAKPEADLMASFAIQYPGKEVYEPATGWIIQDMPQENSDGKAIDETGLPQQATLDSNGKMDLQTLYHYIQTENSLVLIPPNDKKQYDKIIFNIALKDITPTPGQYNYELQGKAEYASVVFEPENLKTFAPYYTIKMKKNRVKIINIHNSALNQEIVEPDDSSLEIKLLMYEIFSQEPGIYLTIVNSQKQRTSQSFSWEDAKLELFPIDINSITPGYLKTCLTTQATEKNYAELIDHDWENFFSREPGIDIFCEDTTSSFQLCIQKKGTTNFIPIEATDEPHFFKVGFPDEVRSQFANKDYVKSILQNNVSIGDIQDVIKNKTDKLRVMCYPKPNSSTIKPTPPSNDPFKPPPPSDPFKPPQPSDPSKPPQTANDSFKPPPDPSIPTRPSDKPSTASRVIHWVLVRETNEKKDLAHWSTRQVAMTKELCALGKNKLAQKENVHIKIYAFYFSSETQSWELHLCSEITSWEGEQDVVRKAVLEKLKQVTKEIEKLPVGIKTLSNPIPDIPDKVNQVITRQKNVQQRLGIWLHNPKNSNPLYTESLTSGSFSQGIIFSNLYNNVVADEDKQKCISEFFSDLFDK